MEEDKKTDGSAEEPKKEMVNIGWTVSKATGLMIITVPMDDTAVAIYTLERASRFIHNVVDMGEAQQAVQRAALSGNNQQAKQNSSFFKKKFC